MSNTRDPQSNNRLLADACASARRASFRAANPER